ncbi:AAA family ATPase [Desulfovibrio piger]|uniref:AAA family ATPase n=1 Tax=Desulfovibrio piger TaxID=901 RepID=UPI0026EDD9A6|nr:AAA family ATPase [Desulfovibrio piger]
MQRVTVLQRLMDAHGLSLQGLAQEAGISKTTAHHMAHGRSIPQRERHRIINDVLNVFMARAVRVETMDELRDELERLPYIPDNAAPATETEEEPTDTPEEDTTMLLSKQSLTPAARRHFKLIRDPFDDPQTEEAVYLSDDGRYVLANMLDAALHGNFLAVVGESGSGKTTLRRLMLERLRDENVIVIEPYMLTAGGQGKDARPLRTGHIAEAILAAVAPGRRVPASAEARNRLLHECLRQSSRGGNRHVLLIEEAHDLHMQVLKSLKRFWELEDGLTRLLSIILIGQTELGVKLSSPAADVREVVQRCDVIPLPPLHDVPGFIRHRFASAGMDAAGAFEEGALFELRQRLIVSRGGKNGGTDLAYPLAVTNLACRAMNLAAAIGEPLVTADVVRQVKA